MIASMWIDTHVHLDAPEFDGDRVDANAAPAAELGRVAALIDPKLPKELDLPDGADTPAERGPVRRPPRRGR
jgi:hypothetical protein